MLLEAVFMGLVAAAIGVGAFGFGVAVCVVAGIYPAWKASRERPADALQG